MTKKLKIILIITTAAAVVFAAILGISALIFECRISSPSGENAKLSEWNLILVNNDYHIPSGYDVKLLELSNGQKVDERIYPDLQAMFDDMRSEGVYPFVREGFRTSEQQKNIIREFINEKLSEGFSLEEAYKLTRKTAAAVGNSEHQLGIAVDINADLDKSSALDVFGWLDKNAWKYGFILRYPPDKTEITGFSYEPWHYRYVGKTAAAEIYSRGICLEEYISQNS